MIQCHPHREFPHLNFPVAMGMGGASQNIDTSEGLTGPHWLPAFFQLAFDTKDTQLKEHLKLRTHVPIASPSQAPVLPSAIPNPNCPLS